MIVGLYSPAPQSGKSEVALELERANFRRKGFSDALKNMVVALLTTIGYTPREARKLVYTGPGKTTPIPELGGTTSRYLQQTLGTDWGRMLIHSDMWVNTVINDQRPRLLVIDDLRFPNEYDAIRKAGGQCWRIYRPGAEAPNGHPSEGLLEGMFFDEEIVNDGTLEQLQQWVREALLCAALRAAGLR